MSAGRCLAVATCALLLGCGGAEHVGEPFDDSIALDVEACARGDASCTRAGRVTPVESYLPGDGHALRIEPGGSIEGPLRRPSPTARLQTLVLGYRVLGEDNIPRELRLGVSGTSTGMVSIRYPNGYFRVVEVAELNEIPSDGARVRIESVVGSYEIVYVVGRWK